MSTTSINETEETSSIKMNILNSNLNIESVSSPNTGRNFSSNETPHVIIIEEKEQDDQSPRENENSGSSGGLQNRASDFSLSNDAVVNPDNGEITPLMKEDGNITNDDIDQIECGKSCEGVDERNNPFDQHIYTHYVDKEESPAQPKTVTPSS